MRSAPDHSLLTQRAVESLRELILRRRLWPGQQLRQEELAAMLGMSKSPVREALKTLQAHGLIDHAPNRGYFVPQVTGVGLKQIYAMRRLLETEVLESLPAPTPATLASLRRTNGLIAELSPRASQYQILSANRSFHFEMFASSPLDLIVREVERLWQISDTYRALLANDFFAGEHTQIVEDHNAMIDALQRLDHARLVAITNEHRAAAEAYLLQRLERDDELGQPLAVA
jgi:DNA-binding GntR family transcriptional regulator